MTLASRYNARTVTNGGEVAVGGLSVAPTTDRQKVFHELVTRLHARQLSLAAVRLAIETMSLPLEYGHVRVVELDCREDMGLRRWIRENRNTDGLHSTIEERMPKMEPGLMLLGCPVKVVAVFEVPRLPFVTLRE